MARTITVSGQAPGLATIAPGQQTVVKLAFAGGPGTNGAADGDKYRLICSDPGVSFDSTEYTVSGDADQSHEFKAPAGTSRFTLDVVKVGVPPAGNTPVATFTVVRQATPAPAQPGAGAGTPPQTPTPTTPVAPVVQGLRFGGDIGWIGTIGLLLLIGIPALFGGVMLYKSFTTTPAGQNNETLFTGLVEMFSEGIDAEGLDVDMSSGLKVNVTADKLKTGLRPPTCADASTPDALTGLCADGSTPTR